MKSRLPQIIYILAAIFTAGTAVTTILYQSTSKETAQTMCQSEVTCGKKVKMLSALTSSKDQSKIQPI